MIEKNLVTLSVNLLKSLESVCTDHELAKYIKVAIIHFIHNLDVCIDGTYSLFVSCKNYKPLLASLIKFKVSKHSNNSNNTL